MELNDKLIGIVQSIRTPILFFLPKKALEDSENIDMGFWSATGFLDKLILIDQNGKPKEYRKGFEHAIVSTKERLLKANIFALLEEQKNLDQIAFSILLDEYFKELYNWTYVSRLVKQFAKIETINYLPEVQHYLDSQYNHLLSHLKEMNLYFKRRSTNPNHTTTPKVDQSLFSLNKAKANTTLTDEDRNNIDLSKPQNNQKKNKPYISEEEAEEFLLRTVFNVDL